MEEAEGARKSYQRRLGEGSTGVEEEEKQKQKRTMVVVAMTRWKLPNVVRWQSMTLEVAEVEADAAVRSKRRLSLRCQQM